jgi:hypothetical protein
MGLSRMMKKKEKTKNKNKMFLVIRDLQWGEKRGSRVIGEEESDEENSANKRKLFNMCFLSESVMEGTVNANCQSGSGRGGTATAR